MDGQVSVADLTIWASMFGMSSQAVEAEPVEAEPLVAVSAAVMLSVEESGSEGTDGGSVGLSGGEAEDGWGHIRSLLDRVESAEEAGAKRGVVNLLRGGLRGLRVAVMGGIGG